MTLDQSEFKLPLMRIVLAPIITITTLFLVSCAQDSPVNRATKEKILLMGNTAEPRGLDPHIVSGVLENNIIRGLFEG